MKASQIAAIKKRRASRARFALVTDLKSGEWRIVDGDAKAGGDFSRETLDAVAKALHSDVPEVVELNGARHFVEPFNPQARLVIVGAVHIAQTLVQFARLVGLEPHVVDPRDAWAKAERFPDVGVHCLWPDEAFGKIGIDARTAVVTLTHDPKIDDPALALALESPAPYVGALGSKRTHAKRLARLKEEGVDEGEFARIDSPVGLDIGAATASEIALSVIAQVVATFRKAA